MAVPCFRYRNIKGSRDTKHQVDGNEKLSPMGWSLPRQLFYGEMWEGKRSALKQKRFKDTIEYYLKQSGLPVNQWEKMASDRSK